MKDASTQNSATQRAARGAANRAPAKKQPARGRTGGGSARNRRRNPSRPVTKGPFELFFDGIFALISVLWFGRLV